MIETSNRLDFFMQGSIKELQQLLNIYSPQQIFLVTGKSSFEKSGAKASLDTLLQNHSVTRFFDFTENPKFTDAQKGVELFKKHPHDLIVAVGGGSVMDMAKLIAFLSVTDKSAEEILIEKQLSTQGPIPKLIAVPTTSGTGSEATHFAVVYLNNKKYSLAHPDLLPAHVILDVNLSQSTPSHLTACAGCDALCQAIESYWNVNATNESRSYAFEALEDILPNIAKAVNGDVSAKEKMARGAYLAGKAINITKTTAPHALSYYMTSQFDIPHGHAVALWMPYFLDINSPAFDEALLKLLQENLGKDYTSGFRRLVEQLGLESSLTNIIEKNQADVAEMLSSVNKERLKNNPVEIDFADLKIELCKYK